MLNVDAAQGRICLVLFAFRSVGTPGRERLKNVINIKKLYNKFKKLNKE